MGGLRRLQRGLKSTDVVQHGLILRDRNVLRLLPRRNTTLLDRASVGATLGRQLHELLEGLCKGTDVGQLAARRRLTRGVVVDTRGLTILSLHDRLRIDRGRHLLTRRGIDAVHPQDTEAVRTILLDRRLQSGLRDGSRTRNDLTLLRELGLVGHTQLVCGARQGLLLHLVELLVASRRQVGVAIVQARSDKGLLDGEDVGHTHGRIHTGLHELRLILRTKRLADARLGILKGLLFTLVVECRLSTTRVLIQNTLIGSRLGRLRNTGSEKGNHVRMSRRGCLVRHLIVVLRLRRRVEKCLSWVFHGFRKRRCACQDIPQSTKTEEQSQLCHLCSPRQDCFLQFRESLQRECSSSPLVPRWDLRVPRDPRGQRDPWEQDPLDPPDPHPIREPPDRRGRSVLDLRELELREPRV